MVATASLCIDLDDDMIPIIKLLNGYNEINRRFVVSSRESWWYSVASISNVSVCTHNWYRYRAVLEAEDDIVYRL